MAVPNKSQQYEKNSPWSAVILTVALFAGGAIVAVNGNPFASPESPAPSLTPEPVPSASATQDPSQAAAQEALRRQLCDQAAQHHLPAPPQLHC